MNDQYRTTIVLDGEDRTGPAVQSATRGLNTFTRLAQGIARTPISIIDRATAPLRSIASGASSLVGVLGKVGLAAMGIQALGSTLSGIGDALGIGLAASFEQTRATLLAMNGDAAQTDALLKSLQNEAAKTPFSFKDMAEAAATLSPALKGTNLNMLDVIKTAEKLSVLNPEQGFTGATVAIREALAGQWTSAETRFNLSRKGIEDLKATGMSNLDILNTMLTKMGITEDLVAAKGLTLAGRWSTLMDTVDQLKLSLAQGLFDRLKSTLEAVQPWLDKNMKTISALAGVVGEKLGGAFDWAVGAVMSFAGSVKALIDGPFGQKMLGIASGLGDAISAVFQAFTSDPGALGVVGDLIEKAFGPKVANMARTFLSVGMKLIPTIGKIVDAFGLFLSGKFDFGILLQAVGKLLKGLGGTIQHEAEVLGGKVWTWFSDEAVPTLRDTFNDLMDRVKGWVSGGGLDRLKRNLLKLADGAWDWVKEAAKKAGGKLDELVGLPVSAAAGSAFDWIVKTGWPSVSKAADTALTWVRDTAWPAIQTAATTALNWVEQTGWPSVKTAASDALTWTTDVAWPLVQSRATQALNWIQTVGWPAVSGAAQTAMGWVIDVAWPVVQARATQALNWITTVGLPAVQGAAEPALHWLVYQAWPDLQANATQAFNWIAFTGFPMLTKASNDAQVAVGTLMDKLKIPQDIRDGVGSLTDAYGNLKFILSELNIQVDAGRTALGLLSGVVTSFALPIAGFVLGLKGITTEFKNISQWASDVFAWVAKLAAWFDTHPALLNTISNVVSAGSAAYNATVNTVTGAQPPASSGGFSDVMPHAAGGIAVRPHIGLVGEAGPEAIVPLSEASRFGFGGGGTNVTGDIHVTLQFNGAAPSPEDAEKLAKRIGPLVAREIARNTRRLQAGVVGGVA